MRFYKYKYNNHLISRARSLRKDQTECEVLLWKYLRNRQLKECKFRRQYPIGSYILDFYCSDIKLAIELDGSQHNTPQGRYYDNKRTILLKKLGIRTLRFWDNDILQNTHGVLEKISQSISDITSPSLS